ncbi:MAG: hypothetical protein KME26_03630 [Oscillatoria princeps RMCB-10]|nr:hypothetical protein [Oscillatoria princeps RMCB-10]
MSCLDELKVLPAEALASGREALPSGRADRLQAPPEGRDVGTAPQP